MVQKLPITVRGNGRKGHTGGGVQKGGTFADGRVIRGGSVDASCARRQLAENEQEETCRKFEQVTINGNKKISKVPDELHL